MEEIKLEKAIKCSNCGCVDSVVKVPCPISEAKNKLNYINICPECFEKKCIFIFKENA